MTRYTNGIKVLAVSMYVRGDFVDVENDLLTDHGAYNEDLDAYMVDSENDLELIVDYVNDWLLCETESDQQREDYEEFFEDRAASIEYLYTVFSYPDGNLVFATADLSDAIDKAIEIEGFVFDGKGNDVDF